MRTHTISRFYRSAAILSAAVLVASPALAHHSRAMYDNKKIVEISGVVKEFQFTFPHSWLLVDVTGQDGKVTTWGIEAAGPPNLITSGIHKGDFPPGTKVTVKTNPLRDGGPRGLWKEVTRLSDGKTFIEKFEPAKSAEDGGSP